MSGWIKLHRKLLDNPIVCKDSDHLALWAYLLLKATHKEMPVVFGGEKITLQPGQLITGRNIISQELSIDRNKVERVLKSFENEQQIEQQTSNKNRIISILSWSDYQESEQQNEQQVSNNRATSEQQVSTNKNVRKKEVKKKDTGDYTPEFEEFYSLYPRKENKKAAFVKWNAAIKKHPIDNIIQGARDYASECRRKGTEEQYIAHPATYLNQERFADSKPIQRSNTPNYAMYADESNYEPLAEGMK